MKELLNLDLPVETHWASLLGVLRERECPVANLSVLWVTHRPNSTVGSLPATQQEMPEFGAGTPPPPTVITPPALATD